MVLPVEFTLFVELVAFEIVAVVELVVFELVAVAELVALEFVALDEVPLPNVKGSLRFLTERPWDSRLCVPKRQILG